jgi:hypothetical protein
MCFTAAAASLLSGAVLEVSSGMAAERADGCGRAEAAAVAYARLIDAAEQALGEIERRKGGSAMRVCSCVCDGVCDGVRVCDGV